jgi:hypothetical protein
VRKSVLLAELTGVMSDGSLPNGPTLDVYDDDDDDDYHSFVLNAVFHQLRTAGLHAC